MKKLNNPKFGIDVSLWQRDINFTKAKNDGAEFCIIKASEGSNIIDPCFDMHYKNARAAGLKVGAYYYFTGCTYGDIEIQTQHFLNVIKGRSFEYPVFIDIENQEVLKISRDDRTKLILKALQILKDAGYLAGVYTYEYYLTYCLNYDMLKSEILWIGDISEKKPNIENLAIWQFGGDANRLRSNIVGGVVCDQNYAYYDFEKELDVVDFTAYPGVDNIPREWSEDAVKWCIDNGIIAGDEDGLRLRDHLTREEMCVILYRYDQQKGG